MVRFRRFVFLALATLGLAAGARADMSQYRVLRTPGYFIDKADWAKYDPCGIGYHAYVNESTQNIKPYFPADGAGACIYNYAGYDTLLLEVTDPGRYVDTWRFYQSGKQEASPRYSRSGCPKKITVSYAELASYPQELDIVPLLKFLNYSLNYNANGGTWTVQPVAATYVYTNLVTFAPSTAISREGHTYVGWNTASNGSGMSITPGQACYGGQTLGIVADSADINGSTNVTLYAQWKVNQYPLHLIVGTGIDKIYYKVNGATSWASVSATTDVPVNYDSEWQVYATPKAGYSYTATTALNPASGKMGTSGATFSPSATAGKVAVAFNGNGSTSGSMAKQDFTIDVPSTINANQFTRSYKVTFDANAVGASVNPGSKDAEYSFSSWNNQANGGGKYFYGDQESVVNPCGATSGEVMLYAQWSESPAAVTLPTPSYAGHTFAGWYAESGCTTKVGDAGASITPTCNTNLYAKWTACSAVITLSAPDADDQDFTKGVTVTYGQTLPPLAVLPRRNGYAFLGYCLGNVYYYSATGQGIGTSTFVNDTTLEAKWEPKVYTLRYRSNTLPEKTAIRTCGPEAKAQSVSIEHPCEDLEWTKEGYHSSGWAWTASETSVKVQPGSTKYWDVIASHCPEGASIADLFAVWEANAYKVRFDGGEAASGSMPDQDFTYGVAKVLSANAFARDGQEFLHWHDAKNNADYSDGQVVSNLTTAADEVVTLSAVWSNYHYVRFDRNGATNETEMALQTFSGAETNALSANVYDKVGYTFAGWATNPVDAASCRVTYTNCQAVSFPQAQPNETNDLYAVWTTNRYTIVFDPGNAPADTNHYFFGTMDPLTNCLYDTAITIKCGWTNYCSRGLEGWSKTQGAEKADYPVRTTSPLTQGADTIVSNLTATADGTATLYAVWANVGDLSKAAGLTNAVLYSSDSTLYEWKSATASSWAWDTNHDVRVACERLGETTGSGGVGLLMKVHGPGVLRFSWCSRIKDENNAQFYVNNPQTLNLYEAGKQKRNWNHPVELKIGYENEHVIIWNFSGNLQTGLEENEDVLAVDDITWIPDADYIEMNPTNLPKYATKEEAEAAATKARVAPPDAKVAAVVTSEEYDAMFAKPLRVVHDSSSGKWTLVPELTTAVSNEVHLAVEAATSNLVSQIATTGETLSVSMTMKAGLYYGLAASDAIGSIATLWPTNWMLGTGAVQELKVDRPSEDMGFFRLRVGVTPNEP